ncbi:MAG: ABC transporter permease [Patescibacteria group bacterium]|nr:ABC transporter permease [Patescibacteria group bacterium]
MNILNFKQSFRTSIKALKANKTRSFLTMLGIIIGVASVIVIMSVGAGAQSLILGQIESIGSNTISVTPGKSDDSGPPTSVLGIVVTSLSLDDLNSIERSKNDIGISALTAYVNGVGTVSFQNNSYDTNLEGVTEAYLDTEGGELSSGRFFTEEENDSLAKVVVLGSTVKEELFGDSIAVGQRVKINRQIFNIIGVLEERGQVAFSNYDDKVLLPLKTMQKNIAGIDYLNMITIKPEESADVDLVINEVEIILRTNHGILDQSGDSDDFSVRSLTELLDLIKTITDALKYFLALMAGLSLVVGGIGIMNIMLISVNERTREIGVRKAIGASNRNIISQFLLESVFLTLIGGIIGIILGVIISWLISLIMVSLNYDWAFVVGPISVLLAVSISALVGLVFGIYPAKRASKLEPVEALSYE